MSSWAAEDVWTVSDLVGRVREVVEAGVGTAWVRGEVRNLRVPSSGHAYFTLGDEAAQIRAVCFRSTLRLQAVDLADGIEVLAWGRVSVYEPRGDLQFIAEILEPLTGEGALLREFEARKRRLAAEGWFAAERKRPVPPLPRAVGVVTSATGAALRDVLQVLGRRAPGLRVVVAPASVQGENAARELREALGLLTTDPEVDVVLLVRGGGSLEDLWPFNDEDLVRAVARCPVPVITGVGHETDVTLVDFAADVRAPTPSAAAELAAGEWARWVEALRALEARLHRAAGARLGELRARLAAADPWRRAPRSLVARRRIEVDALADRAGAALDRTLAEAGRRLSGLEVRLRGLDPRVRLGAWRERRENLETRLHRAAREAVARRRVRLEALVGRAEALGPRRVLGRGYALVRTAEGQVVRDARTCSPGQALDVTLARGGLGVEVRGVNAPAEEDEPWT
ncbi:exodeoxyribonuclease VII large subunit [Deferrisoma palaeochoriense]